MTTDSSDMLASNGDFRVSDLDVTEDRAVVVVAVKLVTRIVGALKPILKYVTQPRHQIVKPDRNSAVDHGTVLVAEMVGIPKGGWASHREDRQNLKSQLHLTRDGSFVVLSPPCYEKHPESVVEIVATPHYHDLSAHFPTTWGQAEDPKVGPWGWWTMTEVIGGLEQALATANEQQQKRERTTAARLAVLRRCMDAINEMDPLGVELAK